MGQLRIAPADARDPRHAQWLVCRHATGSVRRVYFWERQAMGVQRPTHAGEADSNSKWREHQEGGVGAMSVPPRRCGSTHTGMSCTGFVSATRRAVERNKAEVGELHRMRNRDARLYIRELHGLSGSLALMVSQLMRPCEASCHVTCMSWRTRPAHRTGAIRLRARQTRDRAEANLPL